MSGSDYTRTPNLGLYKPNYALDVGQWGNHLNLNSDTLDTALGSAVLVPPDGSIQTALNALPSTGGVVALSPNTTYLLSSTLTITKPNVTLEAPSWGTIIRRTAGMTGHLIQAETTATGFTIRNVTVDGNGPANTAGNFEISVTGSDSLVQRCQVINAGAQGHLALSGAGSRADDNTIKGLGSAVQGGYGIWALNGDKVFITNNRISGTCIDAIGFNGNGSQVTGNYIVNCQIYADDTTIGGGQIANYSDPTLTEAALIEGNHVDQGGGAASTGLELYNLNVSVVGNVIRDQRACGINLSYISNIAGSKAGILICGNTVLNSGRRGAGAPWQLAGLAVFGPLNSIVVTGNRFCDTQATPTQSWGILFNAGTYNNVVVANNDLTGNVTGALTPPSGGTGHVMRDNLGAADISGVPPVNAANDAAAATAGVGIGGRYRNGSIEMVRVA